MSELETQIRELVREVIREELASLPENRARLLTAEEAGERLDLNKQSVYRLVREGQLAAIHTSESRFKVSEDEIERFIKAGGIKSCLREVPARRVARGGRR